MDKSPTARMREFYDLLDRHKLSGLSVTQADLDRIAAVCGVEAPKLQDGPATPPRRIKRVLNVASRYPG